MSRLSVDPALAGIAAVERDTGLAKDTLRMWERRYGFPAPLRDGNGERVYPDEQVERLRLIRRLLDNGHRPGKIVALPRADLVRLSESLAAPASAPALVDEGVAGYVELLRAHRIDELRDGLRIQLVRGGLERFAIEWAAPMATLVGERWACGEVSVFEEHLFTETIGRLLREALDALPPVRAAVRPRVLLTTLPLELHGLGLLMAESLMALHGCACLSLGVQTPLPDIARAASMHAADIVALSCSPCMGATQLVEGLADLRRQLPAGIELWAGGSNPALARRAPANVRVLRHLTDIEPALSEWRRLQ
jgi:methylmalonyl-CoA mutase cobalamin-binding subunit